MTPVAPARLTAWAGSLVRTRSRGAERVGEATHPRLTYRPELDGLRAIAVLLVLGSHAQVPGFGLGAPAGVTLFFVLSGMLITGLLVGERDRFGRVDVRSFYARRALRLLPALYAFMVVAIVGSAFSVWPSRPAAPIVPLSVLGYFENWLAATGEPTGMYGHTWSLAVEVQFYVVWPALLLAALRFLDRRWIAVGLIVAAVLVWPWREFLMSTFGYDRAFHETDSMLDALLLGCAIALLRVRLPSWVGWLGLVGLGVVSEVWDGPGIGHWFSLASLAAALAVAGCPRILGWAPLAYVGRISYSLYLWSYLFIWSGLPWPVIVAASFACAALSYRYIERPFLRIKNDRYAVLRQLVPATA